MTQYVIFKELGWYKITNKTNYDAPIHNANIVIKLSGDTLTEALRCAINSGFSIKSYH